MKIIYNDGHTDECPKEDELHVLRHSAAHIMAQAVKRLYPQTKLAYGPANEKGFYYDLDLGDTRLADSDLPAIEAEMKKIVKENLPFRAFILPRDEATELMRERGEDYKVEHIEKYILEHKKDFPYLGGNKIRNYWLYVMEQYTDAKFVDRENISVAPDTHVVQASERLGVITKEELSLSNVQLLVAERWKEILLETDYDPIDIHTPMWLWSRGKFQIEV